MEEVIFHWVKRLFILLAVFGVCHSYSQNVDELAKTPPMGWNSWNNFGCNVSEDLIKDMADAMVSSGMKKVGYEYIIIDDCWQIGRDENGNIIPDPERFPSGMKKLADYIHNRGLKFGIYSCAGAKTCAGRPGSRGYQFQDARQYAVWGVDYLKYDWCGNKGQNARAAYMTMSDAIKKSGRPIVLSICEWGENKPWKWGGAVGQLWRITDDINDCWDCEFTWGGLGIINIIDKEAGLRKYAGPGHWNDPDMLEVGNGGMNNIEYQTHFSMWCMLSAPLIAGNDIRTMDVNTKTILTNKELIELTKDSLGQQAFRAMHSDRCDLWIKPLANSEYAFCFLNRRNKKIELNYDWQKYTIADTAYGYHRIKIPKDYQIRDLVNHKSIGNTGTPLQVNLKPHEALVLRIKNN